MRPKLIIFCFLSINFFIGAAKILYCKKCNLGKIKNSWLLAYWLIPEKFNNSNGIINICGKLNYFIGLDSSHSLDTPYRD